MRAVVLWTGVVVLWAVGCGPPTGGSAAVAPEDLERRIEAGSAPVVLDVRTPAEYQRGHIPGAVNIPYDELPDRLGELQTGPEAEIVVHCQSGRRAAIAEETLRAAGYTKVRDLTGHWQAWQAAERPMEPGGSGSEE